MYSIAFFRGKKIASEICWLMFIKYAVALAIDKK